MAFMAGILVCSVAAADGWQDFSPHAKFAVQNAVMTTSKRSYERTASTINGGSDNRSPLLEKDIRQAEVLLSKITVQAPIAGLVFDLNVSRGDVVQRASGNKPMLQIIPEDDLQAQVFIPNEAIGFIRIGQRADISLTAFTASDFGYLEAKVKQIGSDALTPKEQQRKLGTDAQGLYFPATLQLTSQTLKVGRRSIALQPGMSLTADLHIRTRRFISAITDLFDDKRRSLERLR